MLWPEANRQKGYDVDFHLSQVYNLRYVYNPNTLSERVTGIG
jgi:hypothetical protein